MSKNSSILILEPSADYALLDSGEGEKLERFGRFVLSRPDPQALWSRRLSAEEWKKADGIFTRSESKGEWVLKNGADQRWSIDFSGLKLWIKPTAFKHTGLFPEQAANWSWLKERLAKVTDLTKPAEVLNLFAYTGAASLVCAAAGANVTHVDSSKAATTWARDNAELSGLDKKPIRWIVDDAREFVTREIKRGRRYDGIIMDPPAFGHGPSSELWKIEEDLLKLIEECKKLLSDKPLFFLINGYSAGYSAVAYENNLLSLEAKFGGQIEIGELTIQESKYEGETSILTSRLLPCGIFARWSA